MGVSLPPNVSLGNVPKLFIFIREHWTELSRIVKSKFSIINTVMPPNLG